MLVSGTNKFLVIIFSLLVASCTKSINNKPHNSDSTSSLPETDTSVIVHIIGYAFDQTSLVTTLKYWKDTNTTILTYGTNAVLAQAICLYNNEVYIAGSTGNSVFVWKNGQALNDVISDMTGASGIFVTSNLICISGEGKNAQGYNGFAKYSVNDLVTPLGAQRLTSWANSVFVSGNDIYVAWTETTDDSHGFARYSKNGVTTTLSDTLRSADAYSILVNNNDVYVAGDLSDPNSYKPYAVYWKNGVPVRLNNDPGLHSVATQITISGDDIYVAGELVDTAGHFAQAVYWKNDSLNILSDKFGFAAGKYIAVVNGYVYVAGIDHQRIVCWVNGKEKQIDNSTAYLEEEVTGLVIQKK